MSGPDHRVATDFEHRREFAESKLLLGPFLAIAQVSMLPGPRGQLRHVHATLVRPQILIAGCVEPVIWLARRFAVDDLII